jgi:hypothetical protein
VLVPVATIAPTARAADAPLACAGTAPSSGERRVAGPGIELAWRPVPAPIAVGRPFSIELVVCPRSADAPAVSRVDVDAWMPEHRHGMNYRPVVSSPPDGPLRADGLLFHMPGRWQVVFELRGGERPLRLTDDVRLR